MVLGKISQLIVYERALKNHSDKGNRKSVEFFARLICEIAGARVEEKLNSLDEIFLKKIYEREDI